MGASSSAEIGPPELTEDERAAALAATASPSSLPSGAAGSSPSRSIAFKNHTAQACRVEVCSSRAPALRIHLEQLPARAASRTPFVPADATGTWIVRFVDPGPPGQLLDEVHDVACETGDVRINLKDVAGGTSLASIEYLGANAAALNAGSGGGFGGEGGSGGDPFSAMTFGAGFVLGGGGPEGLAVGYAASRTTRF
eukprot:TRINITY_DN34927_c0_g1_i1.p1 TRINITY_DN34927_c0_g1~~TRINITY_DN34927_c0_g1_i1.p1  ORF type:complete len:222 (-),score=31.80 TRINITY_DN34927_c0_g1_i1:814-1404(-)